MDAPSHKELGNGVIVVNGGQVGWSEHIKIRNPIAMNEEAKWGQLAVSVTQQMGYTVLTGVIFLD